MPADPTPADVLAAGPLPREAPILGQGDLAPLLREAALLGSGAFAAGLYGGWRHGADSAPSRSIVFGGAIISQLLHALAVRSPRCVASDPALPPNRTLGSILAGSAALQGGAMLVPGVRRLLGVGRIGLGDGFVTLVADVLPFVLGESLKPSGPQLRGFHRIVHRAGPQ